GSVFKGFCLGVKWYFRGGGVGKQIPPRKLIFVPWGDPPNGSYNQQAVRRRAIKKRNFTTRVLRRIRSAVLTQRVLRINKPLSPRRPIDATTLRFNPK
ncbi:MAG: hypothetical protein ACF788_09070, partial [Novipirellula sp. JB048]